MLDVNIWFYFSHLNSLFSEGPKSGIYSLFNFGHWKSKHSSTQLKSPWQFWKKIKYTQYFQNPSLAKVCLKISINFNSFTCFFFFNKLLLIDRICGFWFHISGIIPPCEILNLDQPGLTRWQICSFRIQSTSFNKINDIFFLLFEILTQQEKIHL